jgi:hypothetical protein
MGLTGLRRPAAGLPFRRTGVEIHGSASVEDVGNVVDLAVIGSDADNRSPRRTPS